DVVAAADGRRDETHAGGDEDRADGTRRFAGFALGPPQRSFLPDDPVISFLAACGFARVRSRKRQEGIPSMSRIIMIVLIGIISAPLSAQTPTYWQDVRPALRKHCIACHNARNVAEVDVSGGLALDSYDIFMKQPKKPVVQVGKSADSEM